MINPTSLIRAYKAGCGYRPDDVLHPRVDSRPHTFDVIDDTVVVLCQSSLVPHEYTVVGESARTDSSCGRFVKFTINGHEWEKIGRA